MTIAQETAPLTDSYVQNVPDKCDRIVWRNNYYHLPLKAAPHAPAPVPQGNLLKAFIAFVAAASTGAITLSEYANAHAAIDAAQMAAPVPPQQGAPEASAAPVQGYVTPIDWQPHQTEVVRKITRHPQPEYGYTQPVTAAREVLRRNVTCRPLAGAAEGFTLIAVKGFDELIYDLERADSKGYLPDAMVSAWEEFDYRKLR